MRKTRRRARSRTSESSRRGRCPRRRASGRPAARARRRRAPAQDSARYICSRRRLRLHSACYLLACMLLTGLDACCLPAWKHAAYRLECMLLTG
eukprot:6179176-Pleurochrysis_carterae.AAC.1